MAFPLDMAGKWEALTKMEALGSSTAAAVVGFYDIEAANCIKTILDEHSVTTKVRNPVPPKFK